MFRRRNGTEGTADAVFQNIDIIEAYGPEYIVILAGDHIYKMDYELMLRQHVDAGADVTVGCLEVPRMEATGFGVMHVDKKDNIIAFVEKPADPPGIPGNPDFALASMGIYVFKTKFPDGPAAPRRQRSSSSRDFGKDIIPTSSTTAKPWRIASRNPACAPAWRTRPIGAMWERWTPIGRPISI